MGAARYVRIDLNSDALMLSNRHKELQCEDDKWISLVVMAERYRIELSVCTCTSPPYYIIMLIDLSILLILSTSSFTHVIQYALFSFLTPSG